MTKEVKDEAVLSAHEENFVFPHYDREAGLGIDKTWSGPPLYRVYFWAQRPDYETRHESDTHHWHPDSEHETLEAAQARFDALRGGAKKKSILVLTEAPHSATKH